MRAVEPILVADLLAPLNDELIALLRGVKKEEWLAPTAAGAWTVKDIAAHLLDTALRRLSLQRDGLPPAASFDPNAMNRTWVEAAQRISPGVLVEMLQKYGREQAEYLASLDPFAPAAWGVQWAGEESSPVWFDVARELTERWHHQQQIRDALHRDPLYDARYFAPVIDTFVRGVPHAYRDVDAPAGTSIALHVTDEGEGSWTLVREDGWRLYAGDAEAPATTISIRSDSAWRLFTKSCARTEPRVDGDVRFAEPLLRMICVIG
jgi:uncharacterized protein (TIGR03083 family)